MQNLGIVKPVSSKILWLCIFFFFFQLVVVLNSSAQCNLNGQTTPTGLSNFYVVQSDEVFDPFTTSYTLPPGSDFDTNVLGRTLAASVARKNEAYAYFLSKYGVDWSTGILQSDGSLLSADGKMILYHSTVDPLWNMKVIYSGGDNMSSNSGWIIHEGRYAMTVIDTGVKLYGSWGGVGGVSVPYGATAVDGEWLIEREVACQPNGTETSNIHLRFQTDVPFVPDFKQRVAFEYNVSVVSGLSSTAGNAFGRLELNYLTGSLLEARVKTVIRLN